MLLPCEVVSAAPLGGFHIKGCPYLLNFVAYSASVNLSQIEDNLISDRKTADVNAKVPIEDIKPVTQQR